MSKADQEYPLKYYPPLEEKINIYSHAIGVLGGLVALVLLVLKSYNANHIHLFVSIVYGLSIITLFTASTLFHSSKQPKLRYRLNIFDHSAIFILIAGSYTPYSLITLKGTLGWSIFGIIWAVAIGGVILKLFYTGKFRILSTILYVAMGWMVVFAFKPLYNNLDFMGFIGLVTGGIAYTLGAVLYAIKKIPYNHAIFHIFVLIASVCHFLSIYFYVI